MTPNDIEILIHHYVSPFRHPRFDAPAVRECINKFITDGIFEYTEDFDSGIRVTEKGAAWMEMILKTPYPQYDNQTVFDGKYYIEYVEVDVVHLRRCG